jgi:hypothetical protein
MNEVQELLKTAFFFVLAIVTAVVAWFAKRSADRLDVLERCVVTRDELERLLLQARQDRLVQHQENREALERIETKIDANEERSSKTRHDTNESVHELALQIARLSKRRGGDGE